MLSYLSTNSLKLAADVFKTKIDSCIATDTFVSLQ